ncbi:MAG: HEAT repeat domain-containing protein [Gemmataceae bacterium]
MLPQMPPTAEPVDLGDWGAAPPAVPVAEAAPPPYQHQPPAPQWHAPPPQPQAYYPPPAEPQPFPAPQPVPPPQPRSPRAARPPRSAPQLQPQQQFPTPQPMAYAPQRGAAGRQAAQGSGKSGLLMLAAILLIGGTAGAFAAFYFLKDDKHSEKAAHKSTKKDHGEDPHPQQNPPPNPHDDSGDTPPKPTPTAPTALLPETAVARELTPEEISQRLLPSAAVITTPKGNGSGVLVDAGQRLVLTSLPAIGDTEKVAVQFAEFDKDAKAIIDPKHYLEASKDTAIAAEVVAKSPERGLALLKLEKLPEKVRPVVVSRYPALPEMPVFAMGGDAEQLWRLAPSTARTRTGPQTKPVMGMFGAMTFETASPTASGGIGAPIVNAHAELLGIVKAPQTKEQPQTVNIDVTEIRAFVSEYFKSINETWKEPEAEPIPAPGPTVLDNLLQVLKSGTPANRVIAARRLGNLGAHARSAVPALIAALDKSDPQLPSTAGIALLRIGPPDPGAGVEKLLLAGLRSRSPAARLYAAQLLAQEAMISPDSVKPLVAALKDDFPEVRVGCLQAIGKVGAKAQAAAFDEVFARLVDPDKAVSDAAAATLEAIGPPTAANRPALVAKLKHPDTRVRSTAATLLAALGPAGDDAQKVWQPLLKDPDPKLRLLALQALASAKELNADVGNDVLPLLTDRDAELRKAAAKLAKLLAKSIGAPAALAQAFKMEIDPAVKLELAEAIATLLPADLTNLEAFRRVLRDSAPALREQAAKKLVEIGTDAREAVPELTACIKHETPGVRVAALNALAAMGTYNKAAVPAAAELFTQKEVPTPVLVAAVDVLGAAGIAGEGELEKLIKLSLPPEVREQLFVAFSKQRSIPEPVQAWMVDQAETMTKSRETIATALAKKGTNAAVESLLPRTHLYKAAKGANPPEKYADDYRVWVLAVLGKMELRSILAQDTKAKLIDRLTYLSRNDKTPEVVTEANAVLAKLK